MNRLLNQVGASCVMEECSAGGDTLDQAAAWLRGGVSALAVTLSEENSITFLLLLFLAR